MSSLVGHALRRQVLGSTPMRSQRKKLEGPVVAPGLQCCFSSSTNSASNNNENPKSLYRQMLRWCNSTDSKLPLGSIIDPLHVAPPLVDKKELEAIKHRYYLPQSSLTIDPEGGNMTVSIQNMDDLRGLIKTMFRVNAVHPGDDDEVNQERLDYGSYAVEKLSELAEVIQSLDKEREGHRDRQDVHYYVGQVVQHKFVRWRGVVVGWKKPKNPSSREEATTETNSSTVQCEVLLDRGGVHVRHDSPSLVISKQDNWELVTDPSLCRIWNSQSPKYFKGYQAQSNTYQMNDFLAYKYPVDHSIQQQLGDQQLADKEVGVEAKQIQLAVEELGFGIGSHNVGLPNQSDDEHVELVANETVTKVKQFAATLRDFLSKEIGAKKLHSNGATIPEELDTLEVFREMFDFSGDVLPPPAANSMGTVEGDACPVTSASAHVHQLLKCILELREILQHREQLQAADNIQFGLGQVVYNKNLGIRGIVVGIDPLPKVDVSKWAGPEQLEDPFYYVYPDQQDCQKNFGITLGERYMSQANLGACFGYLRDVSIPLEKLALGWREEVGEDGIVSYVPPSISKFKHGVDIGDDNLAEECLKKVDSAIYSWQIHSKENKFFSPGNLREILGSIEDPEPVDCGVSLLDLIKLLRGSRTMVDAMTFDEAIKDIFKAHPSRELRSKLEEGIAQHLRGNYQSALESFQSLVSQDTDYVEAWNKMATSQLVLGQYSSSMETSKKAAALQPMNFQAYHGAGISEFEQGNYENAEALFRQCLALNPWSSIASKLATTVDLLERREGCRVRKGRQLLR